MEKDGFSYPIRVKETPSRYHKKEYVYKCFRCGKDVGKKYFVPRVRGEIRCAGCRKQYRIERQQNIDNKIYNETLDNFANELKLEMQKAWEKYETDTNNVPKPDFITATALLEIVLDKEKKEVY